MRRDDGPISPVQSEDVLGMGDGQNVCRNVVLVVDDNAGDRTLTAVSVMDSDLKDCEIVQVETPQHAIEALSGSLARRVVMIITDYQMPGMTGVELIESLRGIGQYGHLLSDDIRRDLAEVLIVLASTTASLFDEGKHRTAPEALRVDQLMETGLMHGLAYKHGDLAKYMCAIRKIIRIALDTQKRSPVDAQSQMPLEAVA